MVFIIDTNGARPERPAPATRTSDAHRPALLYYNDTPTVRRPLEVSPFDILAPTPPLNTGGDDVRDDVSVLAGTTNYARIALRSCDDVLRRDQIDFLVGTNVAKTN